MILMNLEVRYKSDILNNKGLESLLLVDKKHTKIIKATDITCTHCSQQMLSLCGH